MPMFLTTRTSSRTPLDSSYMPSSHHRIKVAAVVSPSERSDTPDEGGHPSRVLEPSAEDRVSIGITESWEHVRSERTAGAPGTAKRGCRDRPALDRHQPSGSPCRDLRTSLSCSTRELPGPAPRRPSVGPRRVQFEQQVRKEWGSLVSHTLALGNSVLTCGWITVVHFMDVDPYLGSVPTGWALMSARSARADAATAPPETLDGGQGHCDTLACGSCVL